MRPYEIALLAVDLPYLLWPLTGRPRPRWLHGLPPIAALLAVVHLVIEGYRWQMAPGYGLTAVLLLIALRRLLHPETTTAPRRGRALAGVLVGLLVWGVAVALAALLPVPSPLPPTGPFAVGTRTFYLRDDSRPEIYTAEPGDVRELMLQVWYPANPAPDAETAVYLENVDVAGPAIARRLNLPPFIMGHLNLATTTAYPAAPAVDETFPLLIFSHGLNGFRAQNTSMVQELVSHGYVVAALDHTYASVITVFPEGRVALYNPDVLSEEGDPPRTASLLVSVWAADIAFAIDTITGWQNETGHPLNGRFQLDQIGIFGHSTGGGAAIEFCLQDGRCDALVGLDPWVMPVSDEAMDGLTQPVMHLRAPSWVSSDNGANSTRMETIAAGSEATGYLVTIAGASHFDFTDLPLFSPLTGLLGLSGEIDADYFLDLLNDYTLAFFDQYLRGEEDPLLTGTAVYPEVTFARLE